MPNPQPSFRLANAKVGVAYCEAPVLLAPADRQPVFVAIRVPAELELSVDLNTGIILGTPAAAGDFTVELEFHWAHQPDQRLRTQVPFWVAQDPKQLWKNLPSDTGALFWRPDSASSAWQGKDFGVLAASKRGRSHAHVGSFRDDDFQFGEASGWVVACVADGAGSAKYSRRGAEIICQTASHFLQNALKEDVSQNLDMAAIGLTHAHKNGDPSTIKSNQLHLQNLLTEVLGAAAQAALSRLQQEVELVDNATLKDFSSTALITLCRRFAFGTLCAAFWVGDGAVAVYHSKGIELLGAADGGEFAGQTRFLDVGSVNPAAVAARTYFVLLQDITALVLMTDGITDAFFPTDTSLESLTKWEEFWRVLSDHINLSQINETSAAHLLDWLDFWSPGNHDDRTILLIQPTKSGGHSHE